MFKTIKDCCKRYYSWDVVTCMSSNLSYVDPTKDLFYPDWGKTQTCKNDGLAVSMVHLQGCGELILPNIKFLSPFQPLYMKQIRQYLVVL
jgi:hypothetical protein